MITGVTGDSNYEKAYLRGATRAIHARKPSNLNELEMFCKEEWSKIPSATIQTLIRSYRKRLEAVISAKGGSTKY
ncbi:hypothetical protein NFI96_020158 [Prochilodus magdalenae]|nr:hypothetical protein NFI96_020158 [Prochilodus magdalenae]